MARLDIESFEKGIELKKLQIRKLEESIERLQFKIDNTVHCKKCNSFWDAMYLHSFSATQDSRIVRLKLDCPICHTLTKIEATDLVYPTNFKQVDFTGEYMYSIPKHKIYKADGLA